MKYLEQPGGIATHIQMKTPTFYVLLILLTMPLMGSAQKKDIEAALQKLDSVVAKHSEFIQKKKGDINNFKQALKTSPSNYDRYELCSHLYHAYMKLNSDSALSYAARGQELAQRIGQKELFIQSKISEMLILAYRGDYAGVKNIMKEYGPVENIPAQLQCQYAVTSLEYYLRANQQVMSDEDAPDSVSTDKKKYWAAYCNYIPKDHWMYDYYEVIFLQSPIEEKILQRLKNIEEPSFQAAMLQFTLAQIYKRKGEEELYLYYLIHSAINDISIASREMQSLLELIQSPYLKKDNQRAINYAMLCNENAKEYNDAGRSLDIIKAHAIIVKNYKETLERKHLYMTIIIGLLAISLLVIFIQMRLIVLKQRRQNALLVKLKEINVTLQQMKNEGDRMLLKLQENNERLQQELKFRNTNFMNVYLLVSRYIKDVQKYKKNLFNLLVTGKTEMAKKALNSSANTDEYLQNFYQQFDKAYLSTYPDFVERFNQLLKPGSRFHLDSPDTLTPELRIYALVSLGITDSVSIAEFLHYSPQTIYNYRLKIRHNACIPEKDFADTVAKMYCG